MECRPTRAKTIALRDIHPLDPTRGEFDYFAFHNAPKFVILPIAAEPKLFKDNLKMVVTLMHGRMHPEGTMVLVVPHPWSENFNRLQGELESYSVQK